MTWLWKYYISLPRKWLALTVRQEYYFLVSERVFSVKSYDKTWNQNHSLHFMFSVAYMHQLKKQQFWDPSYKERAHFNSQVKCLDRAFLMNLENDAGPRSRATHWKQTVLYLEDVLTICQGEALTGSMTVAPNKKNPRDIDITIKYSLNGQRCVASRTQHYKMRWAAWMALQIASVTGQRLMMPKLLF